jgi:hypothetical protein
VPERCTPERLEADERRRAERQDRSRKRWATATALVIAILAFSMLQEMRAAVMDARLPLAAAHIVIGKIEGGASAAQEERLREAMLNELARRRQLDPASHRTVRLDLEVRIGSKQPGLCLLRVGGKAPCEVRPVELLWRVREGDRKLGTITQKNDIPDSYEPWEAIDGERALVAQAAAKGILQLVEDR